MIPYLRGVPREEWLARHTFYKHIGLYAFRTDVLRAVTDLPQSALEKAESLEQLRWLENGYKIGVGISEVETVGIDTPEDLEKAERFLWTRVSHPAIVFNLRLMSEVIARSEATWQSAEKRCDVTDS